METIITTQQLFRCRCGGAIRPVRTQDVLEESGSHWMRHICHSCYREFGPEWIDRSHGESDPVPRLDVEASLGQVQRLCGGVKE